ncbi:hypothetical protein COT99_04335 [Candidatus Falkowbacteria bacterium CG10_big_fil_rev_8_21_14_0_10_43_10]|uniref:Uncharacterized protein n=1 Tax=Candidatus Falkowbacteria bacterium CG10_big_fil_rev_8_21_14_0_10_43_10 TaxID=1974567 RepID=A0A2H0V2Y2_9BACT|nr:MAG: hypothetical protein COT99_04335 [Candidatus Falkowbacteria bacterium CG10_big_fil_rev_8_21_14_0_10_43_10]
MFQYLEKFKKLPADLQSVVSSPQAMKTIDELEEKHGIELDVLAIKIMVKEISWNGLENFLAREHNLSPEEAGRLVEELEQKIFTPARDYLGINATAPAPSTAGRPVVVNEPVRQASVPVPAPAVKNEQTPFKIKSVKLSKEDINKVIPARIASAAAPIKEPELDPGGSVISAIDEIMMEAANLAGISQKDGDRIRRLKNVIKIFIKGVRDKFDTEEALIKPLAAGGLALSKEQAGKIINLAEKERKHRVPKKLISQPLRSPLDSLFEVQDVDYDFNSFKKPGAAAQSGPVEDKSFRELIAENQSRPDIGAKTKEDDDQTKLFQNRTRPLVISPEKIKEAEEKVEAKKKNAALISRQAEITKGKDLLVHVRRPIISFDKNKPRLDDIIKPISRLQGPVEELANMNIINFRRLSADPEAAAGRLKNKIDLLEEESFTKRQQGVNAWQHSPIYKMYIDLGRQSIDNSRPVEELIKEKGSAGDKNILTIEEFNAILELNKALRV